MTNAAGVPSGNAEIDAVFDTYQGMIGREESLEAALSSAQEERHNLIGRVRKIVGETALVDEDAIKAAVLLSRPASRSVALERLARLQTVRRRVSEARGQVVLWFNSIPERYQETSHGPFKERVNHFLGLGKVSTNAVLTLSEKGVLNTPLLSGFREQAHTFAHRPITPDRPFRGLFIHPNVDVASVTTMEVRRANPDDDFIFFVGEDQIQSALQFSSAGVPQNVTGLMDQLTSRLF